MNTIFDIDLTDNDLQNTNYHFQPILTKKLDNLESDFNQSIINEIVLWKVSRFSQLDGETLQFLNKIKKSDEFLDKVLTKEILRRLLSTNGIQLAMASTIMRFKNPTIYQIIDQRVYRFIYGKNLPIYFSNHEKQIELYLEYLDKLQDVCHHKNINYEFSDRIIYDLDKHYNKAEKIRY